MKKRIKLGGFICCLLAFGIMMGNVCQVFAFGLKFAKEHATIADAYVEDLTKADMFVQENGESQGGTTHYYKVCTNSKYASMYFFTHNTKPLEVSVLDANGVKQMDVPVIQANISDFKKTSGDYDVDAIFGAATSGVVLKPNTTYYIKVDVESSYRYLYAFDQYDDNANKDFASAKTMSVNRSNQSGIAQTDNAEFYYKFQTDSGNYFYRFNVQNLSTTSSDPRMVELYVYDNNKQLVARGQGSSKTVLMGPCKLKPGKTYYVRVVCAKKNSHFSVSVISFNDEAQDTMSAAGSITQKKDYVYRIQNDADVDWVKLKTSSAKKYQIFCSGGAGMSIQLKDGKGKTIATITKTTTLTLKANTTYYIKMCGKANSSCKISYSQVASTSAKYISVKKITLNRKKLKLKKGKTFTLKVKKVQPAGVCKKSVQFKSSKPKIVKVVKGGKIKALKKGKAVITCTYTAKGNSKKKAKCTVIVK